MSQIELVNVRGTRVLPGLPGNLAFTQGNIWHVKPYSGNDSNTGKRPDQALKTLVKAQALATANQNDIVLLYSESNSASLGAADLIAATVTTGLLWAKDGVHLIGINSGAMYGSRSGIRYASGFASAGPLFTCSGDNCYISNIYFYVGVADVTPLGCVLVSGSHNKFENCHIAGMGASTNVIANSYSLSITGEENVWDSCMIGHGQQRGGVSTTCEILTATGMTRPIFKDCIIFFGNAGSATNHAAVRVGAGNMDFMLFDHCKFICGGTNAGGLAITYAFVVNGAPGGTILLDYCSSCGITDWSDNSGFIWAPTLTDGTITGGIGVVQTKS